MPGSRMDNTFEILIHLYTGQIVFPDPVAGLGTLVRILSSALTFFHPLQYLVFRKLQFFCEYTDDFLRILQLVMYHRDRTDRLIIRQHCPVNIQIRPLAALISRSLS